MHSLRHCSIEVRIVVTRVKQKAGLDLKAVRGQLGLSQAEFAALVGFSPRTIQSCEQGWRKPSAALEKMALLLLIAEEQGEELGRIACWEIVNCPPDLRDTCTAYRSRQGHLCWFLTGTVCGGRRLHNWDDKKARCSVCPVFQRLTDKHGSGPSVNPCEPEEAAK